MTDLPREEARSQDTTAPAEAQPSSASLARLLLPTSLIAVLLVLAVVGATLWQARLDAQRQASRDADNLLHSVIGYINQRIQLSTFALNTFADRLRDPEIAALSSSAQAHVLALIAEHGDYVGNAVVLDPAGKVGISSQPEASAGRSFADRDYFKVQRDNPNAGIYISEPFESRLRGNDPSIALSRRLPTSDGHFAGVIAVVERLASIQAFFSTLDVGPRGALMLLETQGSVLSRQPPPTGPPRVGPNLLQSPEFGRIFVQRSGHFTATSVVDRTERYYTFARVPRQQLIVTVGLATADIFAEWWQRSFAAGGVTLLACGIIILFAVLLRRELHRRIAAQARLARLSVTDGLTGLANRRRYDAALADAWRRACRASLPLSLLILDLDRFKRLNDTYGHATGDEVLKAFARIIGAHLRRPEDVGARYGGEEFAVILPNTDGDGAVAVAEAIRADCEADHGDLPKFTVSIGVNTVRPAAGLSSTSFQEAADQALYRAKHEGRNRVTRAN